ncbi:MerR family DNA-binding transcriptional regulator [Streptomyces sp. NPDC048566]
MARVVARTGLSHDTLRSCEKAGLIERVGRTTGNQRLEPWPTWPGWSS